MKRFISTICLAMIAASVFTSSACALAGKGIFNCGGFPRTGQYGKNDPLVTGCEMLFEWREIEPKEGQYDFELIDHEMAPWLKAGKVVAIRIMTACNEKNATPMWVFEQAGVPMVDSKLYSDSDIIFPQFWNDTFVSKYEAMVKALAKKYDGHPGIEFIQVGGVGRWEETYVHTENDKMSKRWQELGYSHRTYLAHVKRMSEIFKRNFKKTPVLLSLSIGGPDSRENDRTVIGYTLADYAVSRGLYLKQNGWSGSYSFTDHEHFSRIFQRYRGKTKLFFEQGYDVTSPWSPEQGCFRSAINRALIDCVDYLWIYESDISKPEFQKDLKFAVDHLGQKSYKDAGELYIEFNEAKKHYENPASDKVHQDEMYGIYNRNPYFRWKEGALTPAEIGGRQCKKTTSETPYVDIDVEDTVILEEGGTTNCVPSLTMKIEYWDEGTGTIRVDHNWDGKAFCASTSFRKGNTGKWQTKELKLIAVSFPQCVLSTPEKDFAISCEGEDLYISKVSLKF